MAKICKNPNCGADNPDDAKICSKCGCSFSVKDSGVQKKMDTSRQLLLAAVLFVITIAVGTGISSGDWWEFAVILHYGMMILGVISLILIIIEKLKS
jgi:hypothetical protein